MKRFASALLLGVVFAFAGMSTAFADYGYSGYRTGYHAPKYGHSAYGGGYSQYRYVKTYKAPAVYVAPHCDYYGR